MDHVRKASKFVKISSFRFGNFLLYNLGWFGAGRVAVNTVGYISITHSVKSHAKFVTRNYVMSTVSRWHNNALVLGGKGRALIS